LVEKWDKNEVLSAYKEAPKKGLSTNLMGKNILYWSSLLLKLSKKGLENRNILNKKKINEVKYLDHLEKIINNKETIADHMIKKFSKIKNLEDFYEK